MADTIMPDADRLPWLTDERAPKRASNSWWRVPLAITAMCAIAAGGFLFGLTRPWSADVPFATSGNQASTILPAPSPAPADPVVSRSEIAPMPQVEPAPAPAPVVIRMQEDVRPSINSAPSLKRVESPVPAISAEPTAPVKETAPVRKPLQFSNPWDSSAASGRMVRIGTYSSLRQGKLAWAKLARSFPGMKKLPAVVTDIPSLRNGRVYYRLQIGTTSQAHSEVLCQRMRAIGQSCIVVDLAGARKGSGDERQPADV